MVAFERFFDYLDDTVDLVDADNAEIFHVVLLEGTALRDAAGDDNTLATI